MNNEREKIPTDDNQAKGAASQSIKSVAVDITHTLACEI